MFMHSCRKKKRRKWLVRYGERGSSRIQREEKGRKKMNAALPDAAQLRNLIFCI